MLTQNHNDYTYIHTVVGFGTIFKAAVGLEEFLIADGSPRQAAAVAAALAKLESKLIEIAKETAIEAEASIQDHEVNSRVRPDTGGGGGPRLGDFVGRSAALTAVPGSVGINHEPTLDNNGVRWWPTNEYGSHALIGHTFIGAFDGTKPSKAMSGQHALLVMGRTPGAGKGTIEEPIPARHFVEDGMRAVEPQWHTRVRAAKAEFAAVVRSVGVPGK